MIHFEITEKSNVAEKVDKIYQRENGKTPIKGRVNRFLQDIRSSCSFTIENPYVDKVYRDSYYNYFSSKLGKRKRDCIRVCIFETKINESDFYTKSGQKKLKQNYAGFFIIRPTIQNPIGRSCLSPSIYNHSNFLTCQTSIETSCNGVKLNVKGFPYASQDVETMTCAKTTLWAIMEYFGTKYPEYKPILPSDTNKILKSRLHERQLPAAGLYTPQISYALKQFGFGTKIYNHQRFPNFENLLNCYVESGIPIVTILQGNQEGHANILTGREKINLKEAIKTPKKNGFIDLDDYKKELVFIDDNLPPYRTAPFDKPAKNYSNWNNCKITNFITPLYPKIYLDAHEAKKFAKQFLIDHNIRDLYLRFFLTSTRSFKNEMITKKNLNSVIKRTIIKYPMPKFIWIGELYSKDDLLNKKASGLIALDATEANTMNFAPLLFAFYGKEFFFINDKLPEVYDLKKPVDRFDIYTNNLNGF